MFLAAQIKVLWAPDAPQSAAGRVVVSPAPMSRRRDALIPDARIIWHNIEISSISDAKNPRPARGRGFPNLPLRQSRLDADRRAGGIKPFFPDLPGCFLLLHDLSLVR